MRLQTKQVDFVKKYYYAAKNNEANTGISAVFTLAQAALETGWGGSAIGNNIFGITAGDKWQGKRQFIRTFEIHDNPNVGYQKIESITQLANGKYKYIVWRWFRDYDSVEECFKDHFKVLSSKYFADDLQYRTDPRAYVRAIQTPNEFGKKYATAPNYVDVMLKIIDIIEFLINTYCK